MVLVIVLTLVVGVVSISYADTVKDAFDKVSSGKGGTSSVLGDGTKEKVDGLSQDFIDIIATIAMTVLICSCMWTATKISTVGDNAQKKMAVKGAVLLQVLGIVYLANIISFISFSFGNLKIF